MLGMEIRKPHHTPLSSLPRRGVGDTIARSPLFSTPVKQLGRTDCEEHSFKAKVEKLGATENLVGARINGVNAHNSTCSTPIKTPFGIPSQLQTLSSKVAILSASGYTHSDGGAGCGAKESASILRTPFRLLAGKNLKTCLFSPLRTPGPFASPAAFDKLDSPALKGHARRVFVMPPQLSSPARRVPLKQKGSQTSTVARKQSPFLTPKSIKVDRAPCENGNGSVTQHHDLYRKNPEQAPLPKRVLAFTPQQSAFVTPNSSRVDNVLEGTCQNEGAVGSDATQRDVVVKGERAELERLAWLKRVCASMPQLSTPARRVPVQHKQKQLSKKLSPLHNKEKQPSKKVSPLHNKEKQPSKKHSPLRRKEKQSRKKISFSETPKTCRTGERKVRSRHKDAKVADAKKSFTGSIAKQQSENNDVDEIGSGDSKQNNDGTGARNHDELNAVDYVQGQCNENNSVSDNAKHPNDVKQPNDDHDVDIGCNDAKQLHEGDRADIGGKQHEDVDRRDYCEHVDEVEGTTQECHTRQWHDDTDDDIVCNGAMQSDDDS